MDTLKTKKSSRLWQIHLYGDTNTNKQKQTLEKLEKKQKLEKLTSKQVIHWLDLYNLKNYKNLVKLDIEKLQTKLEKLENQNLKNLVNRKIEKLLFTLQTYTQQIFDLYFDSDSQTKYNYDLLHFDLLLKNDCLTSQLLYYRLIDTKNKSKDFDTYIFDSDFVKTQVYNKKEDSICQKLTNQIILDTISKNDKIKLDFIKIYYSKLDDISKDTNTRKTISNYKKYIIDRYNYLFSDSIIH